MTDKFILDSHGEPLAAPDLMTWAHWFEQSKDKRIVKQEIVGDTKVSTVFLSVDHGFGSPLPILWETMCFGGSMDLEQDRCGGGREQAEAMHQKMVNRVMGAI